jgi:plastocyanin
MPWIFVLVLVAIIGPGAAGPGVRASEAEVAVAIVEGNPGDPETWRYEPADVTVPAGGTVVWRNDGDVMHTVTSDDGAFDSGDIPPGLTFRWRFATPGSYAYHCTPHPWMQGVVQVTSP